MGCFPCFESSKKNKIEVKKQDGNLKKESSVAPSTPQLSRLASGNYFFFLLDFSSWIFSFSCLILGYCGRKLILLREIY